MMLHWTLVVSIVVAVCLEKRSVLPFSIRGDVNVPTLNLVDSRIQRNSVEIRSRLGEPVEESICHAVLPVPDNLEFISKYNFYKKYTHAYGIPIISSNAVSDAALRRACEVVQLMLADQHALRWYVYKNFGRVGIIAVTEETTTIPEHRALSPYYNVRARGLGATLHTPISTVGEENLLCEAADKYYREDILVHEFAHSIMELALMRSALPGYIEKLKLAYDDAIRTGKWYRTYAATNIGDYFAEGVQSYFESNAESKVPDGVHNHVNTRRELKRYDPKLYTLMREVFPCGNKLKPRCTFSSGNQEPFRMDCPITTFSPRMDLSYLFSNDYHTEMEQEEEEPLILIASPSTKRYPYGELKPTTPDDAEADFRSTRNPRIETKISPREFNHQRKSPMIDPIFRYEEPPQRTAVVVEPAREIERKTPAIDPIFRHEEDPQRKAVVVGNVRGAGRKHSMIDSIFRDEKPPQRTAVVVEPARQVERKYPAINPIFGHEEDPQSKAVVVESAPETGRKHSMIDPIFRYEKPPQRTEVVIEPARQFESKNPTIDPIFRQDEAPQRKEVIVDTPTQTEKSKQKSQATKGTVKPTTNTKPSQTSALLVEEQQIVRPLQNNHNIPGEDAIANRPKPISKGSAQKRKTVLPTNRLNTVPKTILISKISTVSDKLSTEEPENNFIETEPVPHTASPTEGTKDESDCTDKGWYCDFYVKRDACHQHLDWMYDNCRKSCKLCNMKARKACKDSDPSCYIWAMAGHCQPHKISYKHMVELCPKACKFCS